MARPARVKPRIASVAPVRMVASAMTIRVAGRRWGLLAATSLVAVTAIRVAITAEVEVSGPPMPKGKELFSATAAAPTAEDKKATATP